MDAVTLVFFFAMNDLIRALFEKIHCQKRRCMFLGKSFVFFTNTLSQEFKHSELECLLICQFWRKKFLVDNSFHIGRQIGRNLSCNWTFALSSVSGDFGALFQGLFKHSTLIISHYYLQKSNITVNIIENNEKNIFIFFFLFLPCWDFAITFWHRLSSCSDLCSIWISQFIFVFDSEILQSIDNNFLPFLSPFQHLDQILKLRDVRIFHLERLPLPVHLGIV